MSHRNYIQKSTCSEDVLSRPVHDSPSHKGARGFMTKYNDKRMHCFISLITFISSIVFAGNRAKPIPPSFNPTLGLERDFIFFKTFKIDAFLCEKRVHFRGWDITESTQALCHSAFYPNEWQIHLPPFRVYQLLCIKYETM